jgi:hypothetical protein
MEATVNVQGFEELKRVLSSVPEGQLDMTNWNSCACGHATRDEWFRSQGLTTCTDFPTAAAFFGITRGQAEALFSGRNGRRVTTTEVIQNIDQLLVRPRIREDSEVARTARRQAVIDGLLVKANKAAQHAKRGVTALMAVFF